jgi:muramoyltetrapeptide carboxypeptidase
MKRKKFIDSLLTAAAALHLPGIAGPGTFPTKSILTESGPIKIPPYLNPNDVIGITSPAGFITFEDIQPAIEKMREWGYYIKVGNTIGKRDFNFGGTDDERLADLQSMIDDAGIKAIMCARGGYGLVRIIDKLDFTKFIAHPKWIIGFSDITVMHSHIQSNYNIASIHSKMCNSFPGDWNMAELVQKNSIESIHECLSGKRMMYSTPTHKSNVYGAAHGELVGGNLKTLESIAGSKSDLDTKNKILFLEDTGEYLYSIDRMFWNLERTGKLAHLKGLIIGGFKIKPDDPGEEFGRTLEQIVLEKVIKYKYPVCFDFPVGHQRNNFALKCGVIHELRVDGMGGQLEER